MARSARNKHRIVSGNDNVYIATLNSSTQDWDVTFEGETEVLFSFEAPEGVSRDELVGEVDFWELTNDDSGEIEDDDYLYA